MFKKDPSLRKKKKKIDFCKRALSNLSFKSSSKYT